MSKGFFSLSRPTVEALARDAAQCHEFFAGLGAHGAVQDALKLSKQGTCWFEWVSAPQGMMLCARAHGPTATR
ncbi:hypothetical protein C7401_1376 [Paraburkholderia unamae]|nr:hypothetical protein C7401_1376 [Paraburkholderia unamae]